MHEVPLCSEPYQEIPVGLSETNILCAFTDNFFRCSITFLLLCFSLMHNSVDTVPGSNVCLRGWGFCLVGLVLSIIICLLSFVSVRNREKILCYLTQSYYFLRPMEVNVPVTQFKFYRSTIGGKFVVVMKKLFACRTALRPFVGMTCRKFVP